MSGLLHVAPSTLADFSVLLCFCMEYVTIVDLVGRNGCNGFNGVRNIKVVILVCQVQSVSMMRCV